MLPAPVNFDKVTPMPKDKPLVVKPGQKLMHKRKNTIYIVKSIKDKNVVLVSEKGGATMLIQTSFKWIRSHYPGSSPSMINADPLCLQT